MALLPPRPKSDKPTINYERAALILLDAIVMGDKPAAAKHQVNDKTVRNHRRRLKTDRAFAAFFHAFREKKERDWKTVRLRFLRRGIAKLEELIELADSPKHISAVSDAVKTVGELQIVSDALNVGHRTDLEDEEPAEDPGGPAEGSPASPTLQ